jgi:hypothetical protein
MSEDRQKQIVLVFPETKQIGQTIMDCLNEHYKNDGSVEITFSDDVAQFNFVLSKMEEFEQISQEKTAAIMLEKFKNDPTNRANAFALAVKMANFAGYGKGGWFGFEKISKTSTVKSKDKFIAIMSQLILFEFAVEDENLPGLFKIILHPEQKIGYYRQVIKDKQKDIEAINELIVKEQQISNTLFDNGFKISEIKISSKESSNNELLEEEELRYKKAEQIRNEIDSETNKETEIQGEN